MVEGLRTKAEEIVRLATWFGKRLTKEQIDMWLDQIKNIPSEPLRDIVTLAIESYKTMPVPRELKSLYATWLETHPEKIIDSAYTTCSICHGRGYLILERFSDFYQDWVEICVTCGHCQKKQRFGPLITIEQIKYHKDIRLRQRNIQQANKKDTHKPTKEEIEKRIDTLFDEIPF